MAIAIMPSTADRVAVPGCPSGDGCLGWPAVAAAGGVPCLLAPSVYPFVRSYEWYLLDPAERRRMLAEHGTIAREYPDVRSNTVPCFALNEYEWILAFEADELHRIVDLMRHLRGAEARRHTRAEIPFFTGHRKPVHELVADLPSPEGMT
jgi:hypothetical protein